VARRGFARRAAAGRPGRPGRADGLAVDPADPRLAERPDADRQARLEPHAYFRFVNAGFAAAPAPRSRTLRGSLPDVSLHGDAHVEQYAVTSLGRGSRTSTTAPAASP